MTNVVCVKQGRVYGPEYVNKLFSMIARNAAVPFRFVCFTDNREGIDGDIETWPLPYALRGWWCKLPLFAPPRCIENDQIVAIDLDVACIKNIDWLLSWRGPFLATGDVTRGPTKYYNGSLWSLEPGRYTEVWERFFDCGDEIMKTHYSDQEWIAEMIPDAPTVQELFPGKVLSFNIDYWNRDPETRALSEQASIYLFHGLPKPKEAAKRVDWVKEHWR